MKVMKLVKSVHRHVEVVFLTLQHAPLVKRDYSYTPFHVFQSAHPEHITIIWIRYARFVKKFVLNASIKLIIAPFAGIITFEMKTHVSSHVLLENGMIKSTADANPVRVLA